MQFLYLSKNRLNQLFKLTSNPLYVFPSEIPKEISNLVELEVLDLVNNSFSGPLPMEIFKISELRVISLSNNNLSGSLPPNMCSVIPNTEELYMSNIANLVGTIPHSISNCSKLTHLELSQNQLTGLIPNSLGYLTHLQLLNLEGNNFTSDSSLSFLTSSTNCRNLTVLSLSFNPINGMFPDCREPFHISFKVLRRQLRIPNKVGNLRSLFFLILSGNLRSLQGLLVRNNKLTGSIGHNLCKLQRLDVIDLTQNQLSGSLPNCLGNITSLREIHVGSNKLSTNIPSSLWNLKDLMVLDILSNNMVGSLPPEIRKLKAATLIDLSMNQFSNGIRREIGELRNLVYLSLRHNKLQGSIPDSVSNMVGLEFLDLSENNISRTIPMSLEKLQYLKYFNVLQFFIYNEALCGSSRFGVPPCPTSSKHKSKRKKLLVLFLFLGLEILFVPIIFVFVWIWYWRGKRAPQLSDPLSTKKRERISYYELLQAMDDLSESNLIGSGSFGSVYKGILKSGTVIAVKVFNLQVDAAFKSFDTECEVLRSLRHRDLVKVITSCSNLDFKDLILEYMPNDVGCGLEYLHHGCLSPVIHCDMKPSNVLLDENMVAHLSDFGISKLLGEDQGDLYIKTLATLGYIAPDWKDECQQSVTSIVMRSCCWKYLPGEDQGDLYSKTLATLGYIAPEYGLEGRVSTKCDVYSYGVMLLEIFTRRKPNEFEGDLSLKQWVSYSLPDAVMDVVDANLVTSMGNHFQKELDVVASIMKVALDCCVESPVRRSNMKDVVGMLQKIKIQLLA
ncbi:hypothetical protein P3S67_013288 [Capsicum chacoense]